MCIWNGILACKKQKEKKTNKSVGADVDDGIEMLAFVFLLWSGSGWSSPASTNFKNTWSNCSSAENLLSTFA
jgi:hypothetical protein